MERFKKRLKAFFQQFKRRPATAAVSRSSAARSLPQQNQQQLTGPAAGATSSAVIADDPPQLPPLQTSPRPISIGDNNNRSPASSHLLAVGNSSLRNEQHQPPSPQAPVPPKDPPSTQFEPHRTGRNSSVQGADGSTSVAAEEEGAGVRDVTAREDGQEKTSGEHVETALPTANSEGEEIDHEVAPFLGETRQEDAEHEDLYADSDAGVTDADVDAEVDAYADADADADANHDIDIDHEPADIAPPPPPKTDSFEPLRFEKPQAIEPPKVHQIPETPHQLSIPTAAALATATAPALPSPAEEVQILTAESVPIRYKENLPPPPNSPAPIDDVPPINDIAHSSTQEQNATSTSIQAPEIVQVIIPGPESAARRAERPISAEEKVAIGEDDSPPPLSSKPFAPGMSATSGPLEDFFPEAGVHDD